MDVDSIAKGIADLATDPARRAEFAALGSRRALEFSWERAAEQTLRVYAETLARGPRNPARKAPSEPAPE